LEKPQSSTIGYKALIFLVLLLPAVSAWSGETIRCVMGPGLVGALINSQELFLECRPPKGGAAQQFFEQYLADPSGWETYRDREAVAIRYDALKPQAQQQLLLAIFNQDRVDDRGWWHVMSSNSQQAIRTFCEWTTGSGANAGKVVKDKKNKNRILVPAAILKSGFSARLVPHVAPQQPASEDQPCNTQEAPTNGNEKPVDLEAAARELSYGKDAQGEYALYRLKQGEALYTAVVVRFTDYQEADATLKACEVIRQRSGIQDVHSMKAGQPIKIPVDMLSDRFAPKGSEQRKEYEQTIQETQRLRKDRKRTKHLEGVVVVLDAGHGGRDNGAQNAGCQLYEDEINYDIMCRVKSILETETRAKVYVTICDPKQQYQPMNCKTFSCGGNEQLLTSPRYSNDDAKISANLRWYLANSYYRAECARGVDPRQIVFTSFHTDALFNSSMRGAMIYIPGAAYRREQEQPSGGVYSKFKEVREQKCSTSTAAERRRDEALSRNFADEIMTALGKKQIRRHLEGDWIRAQIRRNGKSYVPAVLRNTQIPTKVLIEAANMTNPTDCSRLADPQWRQQFAEAYVDALKAYYGS